MEKNEMSLVLQDVRKAYRLLADYQQRIVELLDFIKDVLEAEHYWQHLEYSYNSSSIKNIYTDQNAGRKFLPMQDIHLLWHKTTDLPDGQHWQDVVQSNDLVFDIHIKSNDNENLPITDSESVIYLYVYRCIKYSIKVDWYNDVWFRSEYPKAREIGEYKNNSGEIEYQIYGEKINLVDLCDEEMVRETLKNFRQRAGEKLELVI